MHVSFSIIHVTDHAILFVLNTLHFGDENDCCSNSSIVQLLVSVTSTVRASLGHELDSSSIIHLKKIRIYFILCLLFSVKIPGSRPQSKTSWLMLLKYALDHVSYYKSLTDLVTLALLIHTIDLWHNMQRLNAINPCGMNCLRMYLLWHP